VPTAIHDGPATEEDPTPIHALIDYCRKACAAFAKAQKRNGAHATSIGDAFAGPSLISPVLYRKFALQPETALTKEVQDFGIPLSIHICGNTASIISDMGKTGARISRWTGSSTWNLLGVLSQTTPF